MTQESIIHFVSDFYPIRQPRLAATIPFNQSQSFSPMINTLLAAQLTKTSSGTLRYMSTNRNLTHVDQDGKAHMVDVGHKRPTKRVAVAKATVFIGTEIAQLIIANSVAKGDVLSVSQIAGIVAAKRTSELIPLCHNIPLSSVNVKAELDEDLRCVIIHATVKCEGKTGVEMEALTAVTTAALTIYDMCKALSQDIVIKDIMLLRKSGGKVTYQRRNDGKIELEEGIELKYKTDLMPKEPFVPTHH